MRAACLDLFASSLHIMLDHHTLLTSCEFKQAHTQYIALRVPMICLNTDCVQTDVYLRMLAQHSIASMHMPHVTSTFILSTVWTTYPFRAYDTNFYFV